MPAGGSTVLARRIRELAGATWPDDEANFYPALYPLQVI